MITFAKKVIEFNQQLEFSGKLPEGIDVMNPFKENNEVLPLTRIFYEKYYNDNNPRKLILGINPGRLGAGVTGIPFTDTKRLTEYCKISIKSVTSHEPSSVFVYDFITKYGGPEKFYASYYISAVSPLGFVKRNKNGNWINCNYYDYEELFSTLQPFILENLKKQLRFGIDASTCFVLGKKNANYVTILNKKEKLFDTIVALEHPRYIQQYKSKSREHYLSVYLDKLR